MEQRYNVLFMAEANAARLERTIVRMWVVILVLIFLLVGSNAWWVYRESQFEDVETTTIEAEQDGSGVNIVGGGDINYGAEGQNNDN